MVKKTAQSATEEALVAQALKALDGVAVASEVGPSEPVEVAEGVHTVRFRCLMAGYPGWFWEVNLAPDAASGWSVLEVHLLPGPAALVAPEWVPWSERLEEYIKAEALRDDSEADDDDDEIDLDDDVDGVDIDELDLGSLDLDPAPLEVPDEPNDVFDHVDLED